MERNSWKAFFSYSKDERRGIYTLSVIILLLLTYNIFGDFSSIKENDFSKFDNEIAKYKATKKKLLASKETQKTYYKKETQNTKLNLRYFDPNTATKKDWLDIGLKEKQALSILKYINKGGGFYKPEDINKIYCLSDYEKESIIPYVKIANVQEFETVFEADIEAEEYISNVEKKQIYLNLNTVEIEDLLEIKGVGPATAKSIINYRNLIGGFYNISQLKEVYLVDSVKFPQISSSLYVNSEDLNPSLNLNIDDYYKLRKHPYIRNADAYNIVEYRNIKGNFSNIDQLKSVQGINDSIYERIYRYFAPLK